MTTLYVAGPMSGLPEFNYPAFRAATTMLHAAGYDVLNPVDTDDEQGTTPGTKPWDWYMRHALRKVLDADGVALLPGWENSKGARVERYIAQTLDMPFMPIESWLLKSTVSES